MDKLIPSATNFGFTLLKECHSCDNVIISPFSISTALAMTTIGANGDSKNQMLSTLNMVDVADEELQQFFQTLITESFSTSSSCILKVANGMFVQKDFEILEEYRTVLNKYFQAEEKNVDFSDDESRKYINKWVEELTNNKIKDLLASGTLDSLTRMVLVNAVYFKGLWSLPFSRDLTSKLPFHVSTNETIEVDMMCHIESTFNYVASPDFHCSCIELPYMGDDLSMMILLPDEVDGLEKLESEMNFELLTKLLKSMYKTSDVNVFLPKFKIESSITLKSILNKMGMVEVFTDNADLSGITGNRDLKVSSVIHKSFIEVNEEGTEAAAATGIKIVLLCDLEPTQFVVDHPFMFLIRNCKSGNILFMGNIKNPR